MAQKRMIDKKISVSEQVANLSRDAQLLYTWGMPHADDIGLLPYSHRTLKATVVPMWDMDLDSFIKLVDSIVFQKLWGEYDFKGQKFYRISNFTRYQTLKKDRQPQILLPIEHSANPKDTWVKLKELGFQLENDGFQLESEVKRSEEKLREEKKGEESPPTPKEESQRFFKVAEENGEEFKAFITGFSDKTGIDQNIIRSELKKFCNHWLERNKSGTKKKWELETTFEIQRRLSTWFRNAQKWSKESSGRVKARGIV